MIYIGTKKAQEILIANAVDQLRFNPAQNNKLLLQTDYETYICAHTKHGFRYISLIDPSKTYFEVGLNQDEFATPERLPFFLSNGEGGWYQKGTFIVSPWSEEAKAAGWLEAEDIPDPETNIDDKFVVDLGWDNELNFS